MTSFSDLLNGQAGTAAASSSQSVDTLLAAIVTAVVGFAVQAGLFYILQFKYDQIYKPAEPRRLRVETWRRRNGRLHTRHPVRPQSAASSRRDKACAPESDSASDSPINPRPHHAATFPSTPREKAAVVNRRLRGTLQEAQDKGLLAGLKEVFTKDNYEIISESGLDAYFFLRYLRMLLRIFVPLSIVILPILMPINRYSGDLPANKGVNRLSWVNVDPDHSDRLWAHLILTIPTVCWVCFVSYDELRNFVAIRQLYLTSPAHRVKASAKTVLVRGIPDQLLSERALRELYDVYPGSITKIWINRNYDALDEKVRDRAKIAKSLEGAETDLIKKCLAKAKDRAKTGTEDRTQNVHGRSVETKPNGNESEHGRPRDGVSHENSPELDLRLKDFGTPVPISRRSTVSISAASPGHKRFLWSTYKFIFGTVGGYGRDYYQSRAQYHRDFERDLFDVTAEIGPERETTLARRLMFWRSGHDQQSDGTKLSASEEQRKDSYDHLEESREGDRALWLSYIDPSDRDTIREPLFGLSWLPGLPGVSGKFDKIYHLRRELDRLNREIDELQADHSNDAKFPKMNSAFIQFEQQVAAHMACQTLSHFAPQTMTPRLVEIAPDDVIWSNMSIKWWDRYLRTALVFLLAIGLCIIFAVPVTFTGLLSRVNKLGETFGWLEWLTTLPKTVIAIIQGALAPLLLSLLLLLVPIIFRVLVRTQGVATRSDRELGVQQYYFVFLFIQVFLVVTLSTGLTDFLTSIAANPGRAVVTFSQSLPKASTYFFSYMIVQALGNSAGALLQTGTLFMFFIFGPLFDSTPHAKWRRRIPDQNVTWGTFFPPFTNFAVIGLVFAIIAPLILVFNLITFSLYWIVQRYNVIHVTEFTNDTGGMLFPAAVNQLFTGLYALELSLTGLFFLARNANDGVAAIPQGVIMVIVLIATAVFHYVMNRSFQPLINYLPIAFEDKAHRRDRACAERYEVEIPDGLNSRDEEQQGGPHARAIEMKDLGDRREHGPTAPPATQSPSQPLRTQGIAGRDFDKQTHNQATAGRDFEKQTHNQARAGRDFEKQTHNRATADRDFEKQTHNQTTAGREFERANPQPPDGAAETSPFGADCMLPELYREYEAVMDGDSMQTRERQILHSFNHDALRAERPVVWVPRDGLGISDDEIERTGKRHGNIWMSNHDVTIDERGRIHYCRDALAPDYKPHVSV